MAKYENRTFIILAVIIGCLATACESNRVLLKRLGLQFNQLKKAVNSDIEDLRNEVLDLHLALEEERARADNLEAMMFNASEGGQPVGGVATGGGNDMVYIKLKERVKEQERDMGHLDDEIKMLKKENQQLKTIKDTLVKQATSIEETRKDLGILNNTATQMFATSGLKSASVKAFENKVQLITDDYESEVHTPLLIMKQAFMEEKNALKKLRNTVLEENEERKSDNIKRIVLDVVEGMVQREMVEMNKSCVAIQKDVDSVVSDIDEMKGNITLAQADIDLHEQTLEELQKCCEDKKVVLTFSDGAVKAKPVITAQSNFTGTKDYTVYALFGEDMAKNIRIGSRVIRGKDWAWGNQDGHGPGTVISWYQNNNSTRQVDVKWDVGRKVNYRIGAHNRYDLYIITGGVDFHLRTAGIRRFKPIFGADLEAAITIGTRVIRGEDWSWGVQDKHGPGTVTAWYAGGKSSQQVMVDWDLAGKANYRVGAVGKYDLFVLTDD